MKNILIIYPHWPPSNLAGVHRARLIANYLPDFDWNPIVLTVKSEYYEEKLDDEISKTVSDKISVHYVDAKPVKKLRIIGDIGLRAFKPLRKKALQLINETEIDFIWIPIPSFYVAVLGRQLYEQTKTPYGIDYIDPWVRDISNRKNIRSLLSLTLAHILEPYAVKKASLISGVSQAYYQPVLDRNFRHNKIVHVAMPYGFDPNDHAVRLENTSYPWDAYSDCIPLIYAGAFLPLSGYFLESLFRVLRKLKQANNISEKVKLFFVGTGVYTHKSISTYAKEADISEMVIETQERFPFLHILNYLSESAGVMVIGSTEKHYTASKIFQSLWSQKPVFSIFHKESSAVQILKEAEAASYTVEFIEAQKSQDLEKEIEQKFMDFINPKSVWNPNLKQLDSYSAKESARKLVQAINII